MPVSVTSNAITDAGTARESDDPQLHPLDALRDARAHATLFGEFEGVGKQVLEHLLQALGIGDQAAAQVRVGVTSNRSLRFSAS